MLTRPLRPRHCRLDWRAWWASRCGKPLRKRKERRRWQERRRDITRRRQTASAGPTPAGEDRLSRVAERGKRERIPPLRGVTL